MLSIRFYFLFFPGVHLSKPMVCCIEYHLDNFIERRYSVHRRRRRGSCCRCRFCAFIETFKLQRYHTNGACDIIMRSFISTYVDIYSQPKSAP